MRCILNGQCGRNRASLSTITTITNSITLNKKSLPTYLGVPLASVVSGVLLVPFDLITHDTQTLAQSLAIACVFKMQHDGATATTIATLR